MTAFTKHGGGHNPEEEVLKKDIPIHLTNRACVPPSTQKQEEIKQDSPIKEPDEKDENNPPTPQHYPLSITNPQISPLLSLPRELRDQCLLPLLLLPQYLPPNSPPPLQPPITATSSQLRSETLQTFYSTNTFRFQLDFTTLLAKSLAWLERIGDANVRLMRRVELVGWRRIPFGHMFRRVKVVLAVDLRTGRVEGREEGRLEVEDFEAVVEKVRQGWREGWNVEGLGAVMEAFWSGCADNF